MATAKTHKKKELPPALRANADRLKRGEALHGRNHKTPPPTPASTSRPKIRSKKK